MTDQPIAPPSPEDLRDEIVDMLDDDKAEDIVVIELSGKSSLGDYMIIATGRSNRQIAAMADHIVRKLKASGLKGITPEGLRQRDWVVVDAGDVIVHLFRPEVREFYNLEKMWGADLGEAQASTM